MTLGNMRSLGVQRLVAYCLNDTCRHTALIDGMTEPEWKIAANPVGLSHFGVLPSRAATRLSRDSNS
jgi:hypothetical protein